MHSIAWQTIREGRQGDGEADFVILHPDFGIAVLEVKGGGIELDAGAWFSTDRNGFRHRIKNPFVQAVASKHALVRYLRGLELPGNVPAVCHGVVFPDITLNTAISSYGPRRIIVDRADLQDPEGALTNLFQHWGQRPNVTPAVIDSIVERLAPTTTVRTRLVDLVSRVSEEILKLTEGQIRAFAQLRYVRRALIIGGAGTGKTILAQQKARQLAAEGLKPLVVCYNALLADHLSRALSDVTAVRVNSFHGLCAQEIRRAGHRFPSNPEEAWWETDAALALAEAAAANEITFDAIIIDEGQDFAPSWLEVMTLILKDPVDGPVCMFADSHQELYRRGWQEPEGYVKIPLDVNCRNSRPIAARVASIYRDRVSPDGPHGPEPVFHVCNTRRGGVQTVVQTVQRLMRQEGLTPQQVVVLTDEREIVLQLLDTVTDDYAFCAVGQRGIIAETIHRFKGLDADAVIVVFTDALLTDETAVRSLAYVALSRPRASLHVFGSERLKAAIGWRSESI